MISKKLITNIKQKPIIIAVICSLITITAIAAIANHHHKQKHIQKNSAVSVSVQKPIQKTISKTIAATGTLIANKSTVITPRASGYITAITFQEGQTVKTGETLFQLDSQTQQNALTAAKAAYDLSKLQYKRDKQFLKKGFITQDTYYTAKVALKQNQATLQNAQTNLSDRTITAPFDGTVGSIAVSIGDYVNPGNKLTTLVDNKHLRAEYALPVKYLNQIKLNQPVTILDSTKKDKLTAAVSYISPNVDQSTQTVNIHADVNNPENLFKPGEFISISQTTGSQNNAILIPEQSVLASINGYYVFTIKNNKAIKTEVKIGDHIDGNVIIKSGLSPNDEIVTAGEDSLKNNMPVEITK